MRKLRGTYVHRGDAGRRRRRLKQALFATGFTAATWVVIAHRQPASANAEPAMTEPSTSIFSIGKEARKLRQDLETTRGELTLVRAQFDRANRIMQFSTRYSIGAGLAGSIFDGALREGIDPELAFRLVRLESEFNEHATSKVGAVGLMQLMPSTARQYQKGVSTEQLYNRETNLNVGFRYLRTLIDQYKGNIRLALLAYNRGEDAVWRDVRAGIDPGNGYDTPIMKGYKGKGLVQ
jgi:soluble lytic murein transglycosylase-like protein